MESDVIALGAKAIYVYTSEFSMQQFLMKNGFLQLDYKTCYLKLFNETTKVVDESIIALTFPSGTGRNDWKKLIEG